ncbi:hypothetical protein CkaCkLH20_01679 [Colletotrichum karsti]|uniref:Uncharacterized protein n=1 Tax=Colletotrichum karsti TaxID=1095194 RepID=A0A9P6LQE8_9PEZI|nr:uncharacterized protein CkaCkLH20_01679 [Colletotrichum karsti]KAF9880637.1 hypothetical protein CkaCkLH20_01679 [Colletotrichum karsti]
MTHFFDLPRELRDQIYAQYVIIDGGYILDFNSNTLKAANNERIDLAFMLTCKAIAKELKPIPFLVNTLNFSTVQPEEHRATTGRFGCLLAAVHMLPGETLHRIFPDTLSVPDDVWEEISKVDPKFAPYVEAIKGRSAKVPHRVHGRRMYRNVGPSGSCGETPSVFRKFAHSAVRIILDHKDRLDPEQYAKFNGFEGLVDVHLDPWEIPTPKRLEELVSYLPKELAERLSRRWGMTTTHFLNPSLIKWRYSAAAAAIRFLKSLSKESRSDIRNIILREERISVGFTECHGLGLIPFCQENPRLRVERRVSMWRMVLPTTMTFHNIQGIAMEIRTDEYSITKQASYQVALWVMEALETQRAGMPPGSFTLTLEGDSSCSELFREMVQWNAAWQEAVDLCLERNILPPLRWDVRRRDARDWSYALNHYLYIPQPDDPDGEHDVSDNSWYVCEGFPQMIHDIVAGTSLVKCDFNVDGEWDVECLIEESKEWTMHQWKRGWYEYLSKQHFHPDPPLPNWWQLLAEDTTEPGFPRVFPRP